jgi:hypothetical protein
MSIPAYPLPLQSHLPVFLDVVVADAVADADAVAVADAQM